MKETRPTHYTCGSCGHNFYIVTDERKRYKCEKCRQLHELIPTKYGGLDVMIGGDAEVKPGGFKVIVGIDFGKSGGDWS